MKFVLTTLWLSVGLMVAVPGAVLAADYPDKYFLFNAYAVEPDEDRMVDQDGVGFDLGFGRQLRGDLYVEARAFRVAFEQDLNNRRVFYDSGFAVDLQYLVGQRGEFSAYALLGAGVAFNDVGDSTMDDVGAQFTGGVGLLSRGLTSTGVRLRLEGRAVHEDFLDVTDVRVGLGLEIPLDPVEVVVREVPVEKIVERKGPPRSDVYPPRPVDSDSDGVLDQFDACEQTLPGTRVDRSGCAVKNQNVLLEGVRFELDSARLTASSEAILDRAASFLLGQPQLHVVVAGHTDSLGDADYNEKLSWARAQAVADYLIAKGVPAHRLSVIGYGESAPVTSNETEEGRRRNRRVEFEIVS